MKILKNQQYTKTYCIIKAYGVQKYKQNLSHAALVKRGLVLILKYECNNIRPGCKSLLKLKLRDKIFHIPGTWYLINVL